jgi:hypothetical protein
MSILHGWILFNAVTILYLLGLAKLLEELTWQWIYERIGMELKVVKIFRNSRTGLGDWEFLVRSTEEHWASEISGLWRGGEEEQVQLDGHRPARLPPRPPASEQPTTALRENPPPPEFGLPPPATQVRASDHR